MIRLDAEIVQALLHRNAHSAAAAPEADEKVRAKAVFEDVRGELEGIAKQVVRGDDALFHGEAFVRAASEVPFPTRSIIPALEKNR